MIRRGKSKPKYIYFTPYIFEKTPKVKGYFLICYEIMVYF